MVLKFSRAMNDRNGVVSNLYDLKKLWASLNAETTNKGLVTERVGPRLNEVVIQIRLIICAAWPRVK